MRPLKDRLHDIPAALLRRPELLPLAAALGDDDPRARELYRSTAAYNFRLAVTLDEVLDAFEREHIPAQPLKGGLFVETLYGDLGARPMGDLDVLVPPEQFGRADAVLRRLRFDAPALGAAFPRNSHHVAYHRGGVMVELHWKLFHELAIDGDGAEFFRRTVRVPFRGRELAVAELDLQLFFVLAHAATHALTYAATWIIDAVLLVRAGARWEEVERLAARRNARRAIAAAAGVVNRDFVGTTTLDSRPATMRDRALHALIGPGAAPIPYGRGLRSIAVRLLLIDRTRDLSRMLASKMHALRRMHAPRPIHHRSSLP